MNTVILTEEQAKALLSIIQAKQKGDPALATVIAETHYGKSFNFYEAMNSLTRVSDQVWYSQNGQYEMNGQFWKQVNDWLEAAKDLNQFELSYQTPDEIVDFLWDKWVSEGCLSEDECLLPSQVIVRPESDIKNLHSLEAAQIEKRNQKFEEDQEAARIKTFCLILTGNVSIVQARANTLLNSKGVEFVSQAIQGQGENITLSIIYKAKKEVNA